MITLDQEIELFWRRKKSGATVLFLLARYLTLLSYVILGGATFARVSDEVGGKPPFYHGEHTDNAFCFRRGTARASANLHAVFKSVFRPLAAHCFKRFSTQLKYYYTSCGPVCYQARCLHGHPVRSRAEIHFTAFSGLRTLALSEFNWLLAAAVFVLASGPFAVNAVSSLLILRVSRQFPHVVLQYSASGVNGANIPFVGCAGGSNATLTEAIM